MPFFASLATQAPNIANYASKATSFGVQGATFTFLNDLYGGKSPEEAGKQAAKFGTLQGLIGPFATYIPDVGNTAILKAVPRALTGAAGDALIAKYSGYDPYSAAVMGLFLTAKGDSLAKTKYKWEEGGISEASFNKRMNEANPYLSPENKQRIQDAFDTLSKKEKVYITTDAGIVSEIRKIGRAHV